MDQLYTASDDFSLSVLLMLKAVTKYVPLTVREKVLDLVIAATRVVEEPAGIR